MGVPKFFRWLSERYPRINQPLHCPPNDETRQRHFPDYVPSQPNGDDVSGGGDNTATAATTAIKPEFDRLYLDMNGILHCCSHNNAADEPDSNVDPDAHLDANADLTNLLQPNPITEEEVFRNVCYYLDRIVTDVAQPKDLVYMAIDGVAPRAKLNQQRSRRYRSGKEREIEMTFESASSAAAAHASHASTMAPEVSWSRRAGAGSGAGGGGREAEDDVFGRPAISPYEEAMEAVEGIGGAASGAGGEGKGSAAEALREVEPGRYAGKISAGASGSGGDKSQTKTDATTSAAAPTSSANAAAATTDTTEPTTNFHSNTITPGTPFFERLTTRLHSFVQHKLRTDPAWRDLTIIFSGPDVPGEGEHKIMDFIRREKAREGYDPNTSHCLFGQDGDLIMLGLATHEPNFCLLREEVVFDQNRKREREAAIAKSAFAGSSSNGGGAVGGGGGSGASSTLSASLDAYMHNSHFELLHLSILRDYLSYEFETSDVISDSPFDLEPTLDDFVFMTFFVGNDFLPHMPALDIGDEAFDLLFYAYKKSRRAWLHDRYESSSSWASSQKRHPYLTDAGKITLGSRLEQFLRVVGRHEDPYYENQNLTKSKRLERMRQSDLKYHGTTNILSQEDLQKREEEGRERYRRMLEGLNGGGSEGGGDDGSVDVAEGDNVIEGEATTFVPVTSAGGLPPGVMTTTAFSTDDDDDGSTNKTKTKTVFRPEVDHGLEDGFFARLGNLLVNSLSPAASPPPPSTGGAIHDANDLTPSSSSSLPSDVGGGGQETSFDERHVTDIKGRYYYDKFGFTPVDADRHVSLRKSYLEGLVWNLEYYYKGCTSWDWFYPYHYGPMLSDLVNIDDMLADISFEDKLGEPLRPYEQLLGCLPPSSAYLLPKPYRWLMTSPSSPLIEFYPESFTVDMNGKRWPWEAVVLLPFIDSGKLIDAARTLVSDDQLTQDEVTRNQTGGVLVFTRDDAHATAAVGVGATTGKEKNINANVTPVEETEWNHIVSTDAVAFRPALLPGTIVPSPGFSTLKVAPIEGLSRRHIGINVFGMRSRYRTAVLRMDDELPDFPPAAALGPKFVGTTVHFGYPYLQEGFVTAVSDADTTVRGKNAPRRWTKQEAMSWRLRNESLTGQYQTGEGTTGSGGWLLPPSNTTLSIRPLKGLETMPDGTVVKVFARYEVEVPLTAALWSPSRPDPRFNVPARLERDPYRFTKEDAIPAIAPESMAAGEEIVPAGYNALPEIDDAVEDEGVATYASVGVESESSFSVLPPFTESKEEGSQLQQNGPVLPLLPESEETERVSFGATQASVGLGILPPAGAQHDDVAPLLATQSQTSRRFSTVRKLHTLNVRRHSSSNRTLMTQAVARGLRTGNSRGRAVAAAAAVAAAFLAPSGIPKAHAEMTFSRVHSPSLTDTFGRRGSHGWLASLRGGGVTDDGLPYNESDFSGPPPPPPLEFAHGTTTISFIFEGGIVAAVDSRASIGNFVGSKTTQKVLPVSRHILGTMAGGAADCSYWIRRLRSEAKLHELSEGRSISVARASRFLSNALYENRGLDLSVGTMIMGYDAQADDFSIYYVDNSGVRIKGDMFAVGSGSTFALGILDTERKEDMTEEEAIALGIKAIRHATFRDAFSGGYIGVYLITKQGWRKVFSEDLALSAERSDASHSL